RLPLRTVARWLPRPMVPRVPTDISRTRGRSMRLALVPKPSEFYGLFSEAGANAAEAARLAEIMFRDFPDSAVSHADVKALEDEGDRIVRDAIAALFEDEEVSPRAIIRWKDIFEALEEAVDACERAANLVGNIVVKNG